MSIVDILVTVIIVTILVTIVLAVVTYIAYKLRLGRRPVSAAAPGEPRFFHLHQPPAGTDEEPFGDPGSAAEEGEGDHEPGAGPSSSVAPLPEPGGSNSGSPPGGPVRRGSGRVRSSGRLG